MMDRRMFLHDARESIKGDSTREVKGSELVNEWSGWGSVGGILRST